MLNDAQIADAKGYLFLGHKQHDVAAYFGVNSGRIAEIVNGKIGGNVKATPNEKLRPLVRDSERLPFRYFTPGQKLDEQVSIFLDLVKTSKSNGPASVYLITPQFAEWLLSNRNGGNRPKSAKATELYCEAMEEDDWPVTGATIVVGKSGRILDGQHRLLACVRSGMPFHSYIVFAVDDSNFTRIDTGRRRTNIDAFHIAGIKHANVSAKAVRWISILENDPLNRATSFTNEELLSILKETIEPNRFNETIELGIEIEKASAAMGAAYKIPSGSMAALLYIFAAKSRKSMLAFASVMIGGSKQPSKSIYAKIADAKLASGGRINETYRNAIIVQGWNGMRSGRRVSKASLGFVMGDEFPEIE